MRVVEAGASYFSGGAKERVPMVGLNNALTQTSHRHPRTFSLSLSHSRSCGGSSVRVAMCRPTTVGVVSYVCRLAAHLHRLHCSFQLDISAKRRTVSQRAQELHPWSFQLFATYLYPLLISPLVHRASSPLRCPPQRRWYPLRWDRLSRAPTIIRLSHKCGQRDRWAEEWAFKGPSNGNVSI